MMGTAPPTSGYVPHVSVLAGIRDRNEQNRPPLSTGQLARRWGLSRYTIHRMCVDGQLPGAIQHATGTWRIPMATVLEEERKRTSGVIRRPPPPR